MSLELPFGLRPTNPVPVDAYYNNNGVAYISTTEACSKVPRPVRNAGLTVLVGDVEYCWLGGDLSDTGLKVKGSAAGAGIGGGSLAVTYAQALTKLSAGTLLPGTLYSITGYPGLRGIVQVFAVDASNFASTGWVTSVGVQELLLDVPMGTFSFRTSSAAEPQFGNDILVSLNPGATFGRYKDGDTVPARGKTAREVIALSLVDSKFPTYLPASVGIAQTATQDGEVGESLNNTLTATFTGYDAGALTNLNIVKDGALLGTNGSASPHSAVDAVVRPLGSVVYQAEADYLAGALKNIQPAGTPDTRPRQVRSSYAPQAAETNFLSGAVMVRGFYRLFAGSVAAAPNNSASVRSMGTSALVQGGFDVTLNTGASQRSFAVAVPPGYSLAQVVDLDAQGTDLTSQYTASSVSVNDAGGNPVQYTVFSMTQAVPYTTNHRHVLSIR